MISIFNLSKSVVKVGLFLLIASHANAGYEVGNGGDALLCDDRVVLLDLDEAGGVHSFQLESITDPFERTQELLKAWQFLDPQRSAQWLRELEYLKNHIRWTAGGESLANISDEGPVKVPVECALNQAAVQSRDPINDSYTYDFDAQIWKMFDGNSKAALLIHEVLFKNLLDSLPGAHSYLIRPMVRVIMSENPQDYNLARYLSFLSKIGFTYYNYQGWLVDLHQPFVADDGVLLEAQVLRDLKQECSWKLKYNKDRNLTTVVAGDSCRRPSFTTAVTLQSGLFLEGHFVQVQYKNEQLYSALSVYGGFDIADKDGSVVGSVSSLIRNYQVSVTNEEGQRRTRIYVWTQKETTCSDLIFGDWQQYLSCDAGKSNENSRIFTLEMK
ncbi:MAG: hypothetical protein OM95_14900 [Bdellovibrio sp. ArHS]|uniref:hypothetical protein n=1 Tax=Bdellovibrio sp. ArHS TaxID=1569284 RepID=UPI000582C10E|nr:hypothetical protein [Bdellovibrio sp. ArHS]KHD87383.1 MAG: hypothetical protein OM95_14900 [Bdellovibrio sp. ArHS]